MKLMWLRFLLLFILLTTADFCFCQIDNAALNLSTISSFQLTQVTITDVTLAKISASNKPLQLFIFLSPECPVSKNYTSTLNRLFQQYNQQVAFYGCISGKGFNNDEIKSFIKTYKILFPLFVDANKELTNYIAATVTPEVILLNNKGEVIYKGAIDDWMQDFGKQKLTVSKHYLQDAITASLSNKEVAVKRTKAYGCLINDY